MRITAFCVAIAVALALPACTGGNAVASSASEPSRPTIGLTISSASGKHMFRVETAATSQQQARGLMFRTDIPLDGGMLFYPYPGDGGPPREASFWMKDTPSSLDIIFIRADGTIARIAENTTPFSEAPIGSGEPVAAVLELRGGRTADLGIAEGDAVTWDGRKR
ncbi:MAG: hypothetical protein C0500_05890 [Sphingobium sp.]|nr:hypothetical protein [Sphingobium sp.]